MGAVRVEIHVSVQTEGLFHIGRRRQRSGGHVHRPCCDDWLDAIPSSALDLQDREFRLNLEYWLGLRMFGEMSYFLICQRMDG